MPPQAEDVHGSFVLLLLLLRTNSFGLQSRYITFPTNINLIVSYCSFLFLLQHLGPVLSVSLMTAISIDRYMTFVKQEFTCSQRSWYLKPAWLIFFAWVYGTSQNLPVFHSAVVIPINFNNSTVYYCTTTQASTLARRIYLFASLLLGFVIPFVIMIVSYYRVIRVVWTRNTRLAACVTSESNPSIRNSQLLERSRKRVLRVLLIVVICFVTCWLPFAVYHGILERHLKEPPNPMDAVRLITYGVGLANSMCNPFIYYFNVGGKSCRSMKEGFIEVVGGRGRGKTSVQGSAHTTTTTTTRSSSVDNCTSKVNMVELSFDPDKIICLADNTTDDNCIEVGNTNYAAQGSQDEIDTRL